MHCRLSPTKILGGHADPANPVVPPWVLGDAVSFPSGIRGSTAVAFCCIACSQKAPGCSIFWFFGQHIAMSGKMNCQSILRSNLVLVSAGNLRHINIIVVQTGKLIFVRSEIAAP